MQLRKVDGKRGPSWFIDYYDHDGKRKRHVLKGIVTQKNAELAFADFQLKFERGQLGLATDQNITLDDALKALIQKRTTEGCTPEWISTLGIMKNTIIRFFGKDCPFKSLTEDELARFRVHRVKEKMLPETINKELGTIAAAGRVILKQGKIAKLPWEKVGFAVDRTGRQAWSYMREDEAARLLSLLRFGGTCTTKRGNGRPMTFQYKPRPTLWAMVTFLLNTGARKGEMFAVRWSDVDMKTKVIRLVGSKTAKNGSSAHLRFIPMNAALEELFGGLTRGTEKDPVFKRDRNLNRDFTHALKCAELPHFRIHDLRHSYASALVRNGVPLYTVSKLLGHASLDMTQRYAHLCPDTLASAMQTLNFTAPKAKDEPED